MAELKSYQSNLLEDKQNIRHGFFTRSGGLSSGIYQGLNCGIGSNDDFATVLKNRQLAVDSLQIKDSHEISTLYQIHSPNVVVITKPEPKNILKGDAMVTNQKSLPLGILTADCTPVLFADPQNNVIGAAHAGWKGALFGVLENTITNMEELGAKRDNIVAAIGPTIRQQSYEVGDDFYNEFIKQNNSYSKFFVKSKNEGHHMFNLPGFVRFRLEKAGISSVSDAQLDTYTNDAEFFSYRRTTHLNEGDYGRQISIICLYG